MALMNLPADTFHALFPSMSMGGTRSIYILDAYCKPRCLEGWYLFGLGVAGSGGDFMILVAPHWGFPVGIGDTIVSTYTVIVPVE